MKIIEALKKIKDLERKLDDIGGKISTNSAHLSYETPAYPDLAKKIKEWVQSSEDIVKEILKLRVAIQKTNILTEVEIELDGKNVKKSIAEWIHRRRDLAQRQRGIWMGLSDRNLKEGRVRQSDGQERDVTIVRHYDAEERDKKVELFYSEPSIIDSRLEVVNAVTDIVVD